MAAEMKAPIAVLSLRSDKRRSKTYDTPGRRNERAISVRCTNSARNFCVMGNKGPDVLPAPNAEAEDIWENVLA